MAFVFLFSSTSTYVVAFAESQGSSEYIYKASYIYNFTKFIKWPENSQQQIQRNGINLCLIGQDPFGPILDQTSKKLLEKGQILNIKRGINLDTLPQCSILFVSSSEKPRLGEIVRRAKGFPLLLIGDSPGFAESGVGINFFFQGNNIHFEINEIAIKKSGLKISSDLLDLAKLIKE